VEKGW